MSNIRRYLVAVWGARWSMVLALTATLSACGRQEPATTQPTAAAATAPVNRETPAAAPGTYLGGVRPEAIVVMPPAPKPTGPLPAGSACMTPQCHAVFRTAAHIHGPVSSDACDMCHENDQGQHTFPLKRQGATLCTFCHSVSGKAAHIHAAVTDSGCLACHDPHMSQVKFLLTSASVKDLCLRCHVQEQKLYAHGPVGAGECTACHQPHESNFRGLLRGGDGADQCFLCHQGMKEQLASATAVRHPMVSGTNDTPPTSMPEPRTPKPELPCLSCHTAHYSDQTHQLKTSVRDLCLTCHAELAKRIQQAAVPHAAVTDADACANCHDPHGTKIPALLRQPQDQLCLSCHNRPLTVPAIENQSEIAAARTIPDMTHELANRRFPHGPVAAGDCSGCHQSHGSSNPSLLEKPYPSMFYAPFALSTYGLCFDCHNPAAVLEPTTTALTDFRDGDRNLHYLHVNRAEKGRTCKTCHEIHASDLPKHMAASVPFEGGSWAMPINYHALSDGGSCAPGCHEPKTYHRGGDAPNATRPATQPATGGDS